MIPQELGLRHEEQISLIGKVQDAILAVQAPLAEPVKFEAESATSETYKWVAPDGP